MQQEQSNAGENGSLSEDSQGGAPPSRYRRRFSWEVAGELVLLVLATFLFLTFIIESFEWREASARLPRIVAAVGLPLVLVRLVLVLRAARITVPAQIMDVGFRLGDDTKAALGRFARIAIWLGLLYIGIWLFGFHVALPAGISLYLFLFARVGLLWSAVGGLVFLAVIVGLYDNVLHTIWPRPLILRLLG